MDVHTECMEIGVDQGWWPSYDDTGPHPWPVFYILDNKTLRRPCHGSRDFWGCPVYSEEVIEFKFISQLLSYIDVFNSISSARKAGYSKELTSQELWFKKHKPGCVHLFIDQD